MARPFGAAGMKRGCEEVFFFFFFPLLLARRCHPTSHAGVRGSENNPKVIGGCADSIPAVLP